MNTDITIIDENEDGEVVENALKEYMEVTQEIEKDLETPEYTTIEEYKEATGKRFRMTKQDKADGLTREEAFAKRFNL